MFCNKESTEVHWDLLKSSDELQGFANFFIREQMFLETRNPKDFN